MSTNKQALTVESARESGNILFIVAARIARREHFNPLHVLCEIPQRVVSTRLVRDAVERTEENLMREVDNIVHGHDHMAKKLKEAEGRLEAAEKRIAELEALANASLKYASELESEIESMQRKEHCRDRQSVIDALATSGEAWSDIEEYMQKWDAEHAAGITVKGDNQKTASTNFRKNTNSSTEHFRETGETSTNCQKCGGHGTYHCPQMLGTVECECSMLIPRQWTED